ncbi:hypothetical protein Hanom_Chr02g00148821 [Helianthus anomalus]
MLKTKIIKRAKNDFNRNLREEREAKSCVLKGRNKSHWQKRKKRKEAKTELRLSRDRLTFT